MSPPLNRLHLASHSLNSKMELTRGGREAFRIEDQLVSISGGCVKSHSNHLSSDERIARSSTRFEGWMFPQDVLLASSRPKGTVGRCRCSGQAIRNVSVSVAMRKRVEEETVDGPGVEVKMDCRPALLRRTIRIN